MRVLYTASLLVSATAVCLAQNAAGPPSVSRFSSLCQGVEHTAGVALGDFDGDRDLDVIFANGRHAAEPDWVYSNDGHGGFFGKRALDNEADRTYGIAVGDLDGDGKLDAVVANDEGSRSVAYHSDGHGNFVLMGLLGPGALAQTFARRAVALGDFDKDGDLDAVLVGVGPDHVYLNDGTGSRWTERVLDSGPSRTLAVAVADLDGDSDLDIVVANREQVQSRIYLNDAKGGFGETRPFGTGKEDMTGVAVGDVDGDGDADLVTVNWLQPHAVYRNDGYARFGAAERFGTGTEQTWSVAVGDMDLDGDLDVVVGNSDLRFWSDDLNGDKRPDRVGHEVLHLPSRMYVNNGKGGLLSGTTIGSGGDDTRPVALGDLDGDGDLDVVIGNDCQPNRVFYNPTRSRSYR